jgi:cell division protein FtsI/penicillin-binding protein 2
MQKKELKKSKNIYFEQDDFKQDRIYELLRREGFSEDVLSQIVRNRKISDIAYKEVERQDIFAQYDFLEVAERIDIYNKEESK